MNFSVLISVYKNDSALYFEKALQSIIEQTLKPSEIVLVVDGEISVELEEVIQVYIKKTNLVIIRNSQNIGLSKSLNIGLNNCSYNFVARMDSDDISFKNRFEKQFDFLRKHRDISLLGGWYIQFDETMTKEILMRKVPEYNSDLIKFSKKRTPFNHVTVVFRKDHIKAMGGYPNIDGLFEDWWLAHRLIRKGFKLHNLQEPLVKVRGDSKFFKRRGGGKYWISEIKNLIAMYKAKYFTQKELLLNILIRTPVRLFPNFLRQFSYFFIRKIK